MTHSQAFFHKDVIGTVIVDCQKHQGKNKEPIYSLRFDNGKTLVWGEGHLTQLCEGTKP